MGVFNLPNLPKQGGRHIRVFNNQIVDNNTPNFAPKSLGPIHDLPTGTGIYVMAIKEVEAFGNKIQGNGTVSVFLINYNTGVSPEGLAKTAESPITQTVFKPGDTRFYPYAQQIFFHDNDISGGGKTPDLRFVVFKGLGGGVGGVFGGVYFCGLF